MKNLIGILAVFLSVFVSYQFTYAQWVQGDAQWIQRYNGPGNSYDLGRSIAVDGSGNVYVTGESVGLGGLGIGFDFATIKYDSTGVQQWLRRYNGPENYDDSPSSIAVDGSGNVYVTGSCGSYPFVSTPDYATIKYNSTGVQQWLRRYNGPGNSYDHGRFIAVDGLGNVYVTGGSEGIGTLSDYTTIKYNSNGDSLWVRTYNGPGNNVDDANLVTIDITGNVYVAGYSRGIALDDDFAIIKYNSSGVQQWIRRYDGPGSDSESDDQPQSLVVDASGNIYVTGWSYGIGIFPLKDCVTIKYNSNGDSLWVKRYNGPGNGVDQANSVSLDITGNVYITGSSIGIGTDLDFITIKYDSSGVQQWLQRYNGPGNLYDGGQSIGVDNSGNIYVAGISYGSGTSGDYAVIKYNSSGIQEWIQRYNGPASDRDAISDMKVDGTGNVYITGFSTGIGTGEDYATIKYSPESVLPVELASFTSSVNENDITITWQTNFETNNSGFDIERSATDDQWTKTGFVQGNGNSNEPKEYSFTDKNLATGKYKYRLKQIDFNGNYEYFNLTGEVNIGVPDKYDLSQNYPNPFNPNTVIRYSLVENGFTSLKVYDITGKEVAKLINQKQDAGRHEIIFKGNNIASGVYFYELRSGNFVSQKRMLLLK